MLFLRAGRNGIPLYYSIPLLSVVVLAFGVLAFLFYTGIFFLNLAPPANYVNVSSCGVLLQNDTYYVVNMSQTFSTVDCFTIVGNNVTLDGLNSVVLTGTNALGVAAVRVRGQAARATGLNISDAFIGVYVDHTSGTQVTLNFINNSGGSAVYVNGSTGATVFQNYLAYPTWLGVYFENTTLSKIQQNLVLGREQFGEFTLGGIGLITSGSNTISDNYVRHTSFGSFGARISPGNTFLRNWADAPQRHGLYLHYSGASRTTIQHMRVTHLQAGSALYLEETPDVYVVNMSATNTSSNGYDFLTNGTVGVVELRDTKFGKYFFNISSLRFTNFGNTRINFTQPVISSGANLSADVKLEFNFAEVDSTTRPGLNKSSWIRFEGISNSLASPIIYRNGMPCPLTVCTEVSGLGTGIVAFNVNGWTNYSVGVAQFGEPNLTIDEPDQNETYYTNNFPVTFRVITNYIGSVRFNLGNGALSYLMNTTDNLTFTYRTNSLPVGTYNFSAIATIQGMNYTANHSFRVLQSSATPSPPSPPPATNSSNSSLPSQQNTTLPPPLPPQTNSSTPAVFDDEASLLPTVIYWLIISVLVVAALLLVILIIRAMTAKSVQPTPVVMDSIVSRLR
jgi:hypothetical protein